MKFLCKYFYDGSVKKIYSRSEKQIFGFNFIIIIITNGIIILKIFLYLFYELKVEWELKTSRWRSNPCIAEVETAFLHPREKMGSPGQFSRWRIGFPYLRANRESFPIFKLLWMKQWRRVIMPVSTLSGKYLGKRSSTISFFPLYKWFNQVYQERFILSSEIC